MNQRSYSIISALFAGLCISVFGGCDGQRGDIRSYKALRIAKPKAPPKKSDDLQYEVPKEWQKTNPGVIYKAKYIVRGDPRKGNGIFSISVLGGNVFSNVNRWRKQVGLKEHTKVEDMVKETKEIKVDGKDAYYVDLKGPKEFGGKRTLGVIVPTEQGSWFFKFTGPGDLLEREKARFEAVIETVSFGAKDEDDK